MKEYRDSPYKKIPSELLSAYTLNGRIPVLEWYIKEKPPQDQEVRNWTEDYVNDFLTRFTESHISCNQHGPEPYAGVSSHLLRAFKHHKIHDKNIAVVGSLTPWIEAILLNLNNQVTTVEYNVPDIDTNLIKGESYWNFEKTEDEYDCIVTFSSIEHSGLGRYGDPLDPNGDIKTMKAIHKNIKKDGLLVWGAPVGADVLVWNAHRIYGKLRLDLIFEGFKELSWVGHDKEALLKSLASKYAGSQPVVVLQKVE